MTQILLRIIKTLAYIFAFSAVSFTIVYLLNKSTLDLAQQQVKQITPDNFKQEEASITLGSVIQIVGTPDLLKQVAQEQKDTTDNSAQYYYVGLKEFGNDFLIKVLPGKLQASKMTFLGQVEKLSQIQSNSTIEAALNKPVDFTSNANAAVSEGLDPDAKALISDNSKANFTESTLVVLDGSILDARQVILGIALWTTVLSLFLITIFRKRVFKTRK